ncbi:MAG: UDP-glucose 4-epimerase GalE [Pseudomonadota bacterium]
MSLRDRNVLVTGGAGYIGSHAVLALQEAGARVSVVDNLVTGFRWAVDDNAAFFEADIGDGAAVTEILEKQEIQSVLHFAGSVVVPESVSDPLKYYRNNTANTRTLLEAAVSHGIEDFIFSSTAAVYGTPSVSQVCETTQTVPINPYGTSKLMTEMMLADVAQAHPLRYAALRYFNVAGADLKMRTGQSTKGATHLIKVAVQTALGRRDKMAMFGTDFDTVDGTGVRDYIHVSDLVSAHVAALEHLVSGQDKALTMNLGYGRGASVKQVIDTVEKVTGLAVAHEAAPRRAGDPGELVSDVSKLKETLNWTPSHDDLNVIVQTAFDWEKRLNH